MSQTQYDFIELLFVRLGIADAASKTAGQGQFFLYRVGMVNLRVNLHVISVIPGLLNKMAAVGGSINQNVIRLGFHATFNNGFQKFVFDFKIFKGQIVHIDDEFIISVFNLGDDLRKILKLMLVNLDHPQPLTVKFIDDGLDTGGFSGAGVSVKQYIVGATTFHKGKGIVHQLFLLQLVADEIVQHNSVHIVNREEGDLILMRLNPEGLIQTKHAYPVSLIEVCHQGEKIRHIQSSCQLAAQLSDLVADIFVVHPFRLGNGLIVGDVLETIYP